METIPFVEGFRKNVRSLDFSRKSSRFSKSFLANNKMEILYRPTFQDNETNSSSLLNAISCSKIYSIFTSDCLLLLFA
jgi:hypothetical protein